MLFGCSYAYGLSLANDETFSHKLGHYLSNYRIYNRAHGTWSTSQMLYQLENKTFSDIPDVKYVLYVFIEDHISRNWNGYFQILVPHYKYKSGYLYLQKYTLKNLNFPLINYFVQLEMLNDNKDNILNEKKVELTKRIIEKSKEESELNFGYDIKFIILHYDNSDKRDYNSMFETLKKEGYIVVSLKDLSNTNYQTTKYQLSKTDPHSNALAWKEITPLFVKYLQDRGYLKD